jgi:hypothetical protein
MGEERPTGILKLAISAKKEDVFPVSDVNLIEISKYYCFPTQATQPVRPMMHCHPSHIPK